MSPAFTPGDRVETWVWTGGDSNVLVPLVVIRQNRKTVTVVTEYGERSRVDTQKLRKRDWQTTTGF